MGKHDRLATFLRLAQKYDGLDIQHGCNMPEGFVHPNRAMAAIHADKYGKELELIDEQGSVWLASDKERSPDA